MEASHRGFLFNSKEIDVPSGAYSGDDNTHELCAENWTPEQWTDVSSFAIPQSTFTLRRAPSIDHPEGTASLERRRLLKSYAWLYLDGIKKKVEKGLLEAGAKKSQALCPEDAVLHDIGTLWAWTVGKGPKEDKRQARIGILSDVPQEETAIKYIHVPFSLTFAKFKTEAARLGIVRHLTTKLHPALAETLFIDDSVIYHHPYPTAIDESDPSYPAEIQPVVRDYEARDNGWHSHVVPIDTASMCNQQRDWQPINTEEDWQALLRLVKLSDRNVFMRHKSVEDRMDFIKQHRDREELEVAKTGGFYTNVFLWRHMERFYPTDKLKGTPPCSRRENDC